MHGDTGIYDNLRDELLAALVDQDTAAAASVCKGIEERLRHLQTLPEPDQKAVGQILLVLKKTPGCPEAAPVLQSHRRNLRHRLSRIVRQETARPRPVSFTHWRDRTGLNLESPAALWKTVTALQLTVGCSHFCRRCNEWALPGIRRYFDFSAVRTLLDQIFQVGNNAFTPYGASDPLDWRQNSRTFLDILSYMQEKGYAVRYGFLTKIPKGTIALVERMAAAGIDFAVSKTNGNRELVERIEARVGKKLAVQHDLDELLIQAGLDEDFQTIKPSITDNYGTEITPDGVFLILPAFTSALQPTGQGRIAVTADTGFWIQQRTGREALAVEYFKPLSILDGDGRERQLPDLLDVQVENILLDTGSETVTPPGMMGLSVFFQTFDQPAMMARRRLIPAVIRQYRDNLLLGRQNRDKRKQNIRRFRKVTSGYLAFCREQAVNEFRKNAVAFFLQGIGEYLTRQPVRGRIIAYLRQAELAPARRQMEPEFNRSQAGVEDFLDQTRKETFTAFRYLVFRLLQDHQDKSIKRFITNRQVVFDPDTDRFVPL